MFINNKDDIIYTKMYLAARNKDKDTLESEEQRDLQNNSVEIKQSAKIVGQKDKDSYGVVQFSLNEERVNLMLTKDNIARLKEKFDANNFYQRDDGALRLSGKAEAYIGGWLGELLENMGANKADIDKDGQFSGKERAMIASGYSYDLSSVQQGVAGKSVSVYNVQGYQAGEDSILSKALDDYVNDFISADKNLSGKISLEDYATQTRGSLYNAIKEKLSAKENKTAEMFAQAQTQAPSKKKKKSEEEEAEEKAMELLAKVKQSKDIESLTPQEKAVLEEYFAGEIAQLKSEDADTINKHLKQSIETFVEQITSDASLVFETKV